ncbi:hypothetical protein C1H46_035507 [Malus baccata]|uniref:Uncharacterized protein n=1 Tax=Malus baccata TaxID=106549 RepID=A0A540KXH5_MALBA|nr:hypothetical protein C1H46_035507 [Malus baccata]
MGLGPTDKVDPLLTGFLPILNLLTGRGIEAQLQKLRSSVEVGRLCVEIFSTLLRFWCGFDDGVCMLEIVSKELRARSFRQSRHLREHPPHDEDRAEFL